MSDVIDREALCDKEEAAALLGVSKDNIKRLVKLGVLRPVINNPGFNHYYSRAAVEKVKRRLYPDGLTFMQIAEKYGLARNTVKKYIRLAKLHPLGFNSKRKSYVYDPAQVASLADSQGWQENPKDATLTPESAALEDL